MPVKLSSVTFEWKIDGFKRLEPKGYNSELFWTSERHPWVLSFYPHGNRKKSEHVSLYLESTYNDTYQRVYFSRKNTEFEILVCVGEIVTHRRARYAFATAGVARGWSCFELRKKLIDEVKTDEDPILLKVVIQMPSVSMSVPAPNSIANTTASTFLRSQVYGDIIFRIGDQDLHAHRDILVTRSEYFAALLGGNMKEAFDCAQNGKAVVSITDFDHDVVFIMLRYLYTGSLDLRDCPKVEATDLFKIADKYDVQGLKEAMEDCIVSKITIESVVNILFGFAHRYPSLRKECLVFIGENFEEVRKTGAIDKVEWDSDTWEYNAELMKEVVKYVPVGNAK